jgi:hypothetical protein
MAPRKKVAVAPEILLPDLVTGKTVKVPPPEEPAKIKKIGPFEFVEAIGKKNNLMRPEPKAASNPDIEACYLPHIVNKHFSFFKNTVAAADILNRMTALPNVMQFECLLEIIPRGRYNTSWMKADRDDDIRVVAEYYGFSQRKAKDVLSLHSPEQLEHMRAVLHVD